MAFGDQLTWRLHIPTFLEGGHRRDSHSDAFAIRLMHALTTRAAAANGFCGMHGGAFLLRVATAPPSLRLLKLNTPPQTKHQCNFFITW